MDFQENDEYDSRMMGCENKIEKKMYNNDFLFNRYL